MQDLKVSQLRMESMLPAVETRCLNWTELPGKTHKIATSIPLLTQTQGPQVWRNLRGRKLVFIKSMSRNQRGSHTFPSHPYGPLLWPTNMQSEKQLQSVLNSYSLILSTVTSEVAFTQIQSWKEMYYFLSSLYLFVLGINRAFLILEALRTVKRN